MKGGLYNQRPIIYLQSVILSKISQNKTQDNVKIQEESIALLI